MEQREQQVPRAAQERHDKLAVVRMPQETHRLLKATAAMRGESIQGFVTRLVEREATPRP